MILDFGSQYTQLIARRVREQKVYSEIQPYNINIKNYLLSKNNFNLKGVILSGGPSSVLERNSPVLSNDNIDFIKNNNLPVLGICYGLQLLVYLFGGKIHKSKTREYGNTTIKILAKDSMLFNGIERNLTVWMSHGDSIDKLPKNFIVTSKSSNNLLSSFES